MWNSLLDNLINKDVAIEDLNLDEIKDKCKEVLMERDRIEYNKVMNFSRKIIGALTLIFLWVTSLGLTPKVIISLLLVIQMFKEEGK